ncbi:hypothetical protein EIP86_008115 [Pleurotus ostreatoroseus]|nr:hypothetical protein EIP86_008115 [Pleurotus ostreatoroseus]
MTTEDTSMHVTPIQGNTSRQVSLNFDALAAVMPCIKTRRDLFSFMSTCSGLYNAGIPTLLGFHFTITLRNLSQFYHFLISKGPVSFLSLRGLYFSFASWSEQGRLGPQEVGWLTEILSRAQNLHYIEIFGDLLHQEPTLYKALAQLSSLQTLDLLSTHGEDPEQYILITQLQAPLSTLRFEGVGENLDVVNALVNFHGTLRELTISEFTLYHLPPGPVYPHVVDLSLTAIVNPQLSILIPAFPNVKTLLARLLIPNESDPAIRGNNLQYQMDYPTRCWQLSSLVTDAPSLWTLPLRAGVPEVEVHDLSPGIELEFLQSSLVHLRPLHLTFENDQDPILEDNWLSKAITGDWKELVRLDFDYIFPAVSDKCNEHLIAQAIPSLALLKLKNISQKSYWIRQEDKLAPLSPSTRQAFERLSEELLAPLRKGEFK